MPSARRFSRQSWWLAGLWPTSGRASGPCATGHSQLAPLPRSVPPLRPWPFGLASNRRLTRTLCEQVAVEAQPDFCARAAALLEPAWGARASVENADIRSWSAPPPERTACSVQHPSHVLPDRAFRLRKRRPPARRLGQQADGSVGVVVAAGVLHCFVDPGASEPCIFSNQTLCFCTVLAACFTTVNCPA